MAVLLRRAICCVHVTVHLAVQPHICSTLQTLRCHNRMLWSTLGQWRTGFGVGSVGSPLPHPSLPPRMVCWKVSTLTQLRARQLLWWWAGWEGSPIKVATPVLAAHRLRSVGVCLARRCKGYLGMTLG